MSDIQYHGIVIDHGVYSNNEVSHFEFVLDAATTGTMIDTENGDAAYAFEHSLGEYVRTLLDLANENTNDVFAFNNERYLDLRDYGHSDDGNVVQSANPQCDAAYTSLIDTIETIFWDELNEQLEDDALIPDGELNDEDLRFAVGDEEEFARVIHLCIAAYLRLHPRADGFDVVISCGDSGSTANDSTPDLLEPLIEKIVTVYSPTGGTWEYNDGDASRRSGYSYSEDELQYDSDDVRNEFTARELIDVPNELIRMLAVRDIDPRDFAPSLFAPQEPSAEDTIAA